MVATGISSTIESIGDYIATASVCQLRKPPNHVMNRGVAAEGVAGVVAGLLGACHSSTSYSSTVGFVSVTKASLTYLLQENPRIDRG